MSAYDTNPTDSEYKPWEGDFTDLVHVLWGAQGAGDLPKEADCDRLAGRIFQSRWLRAVEAKAKAKSTNGDPGAQQ